MICSPSTRRRANARPAVSVPGSTPPACARASATRDPAATVRTPGLCTLPTTSTTICAAGLCVAPADDQITGFEPALSASAGTCPWARADGVPAETAIRETGLFRQANHPAVNAAARATTTSRSAPRMAGSTRPPRRSRGRWSARPSGPDRAAGCRTSRPALPWGDSSSNRSPSLCSPASAPDGVDGAATSNITGCGSSTSETPAAGCEASV